jgi:phage terminase large subunit GpA-like protein
VTKIRADAPNPAGTIHLPDWADSEWLKQLVAEQLVTIRDRRGYARQEWQKLRERNEALDARVYARAAAWILGADRFDERMWRQLEKQAGVETAAVAKCRCGAPGETDTWSAPRSRAPDLSRTATGPRRRRGWKISTPRYMECLRPRGGAGDTHDPR